MMRRPQQGDLVGIKRLGIQGIVIEVRELPQLMGHFPGSQTGAVTVLVAGEQRVYSWDDVYVIETDDVEEDLPDDDEHS
jgi:hypothetical protein